MGTLQCSTPQTREDRTIYRALKLLESRMRLPGATLSGSAGVRDYLRLALASEEREVFMALWLNTQHGLIAADALFYGTLTQTSVYPREVVKRGLQLNAGNVIFAHNHPGGSAGPSRHDLILTCALKEALALVDLRVLDHFVVAGTEAYSLAEQGLLGQEDFPEEAPSPKQSRTMKKVAGKAAPLASEVKESGHRANADHGAQSGIQARADLSFTARDEEGRFNNWSVPHDRKAKWGAGVETGFLYFSEIAELASHDEEKAFRAARFAMNSPGWQTSGWGIECGFSEALARAAIVGLRALRNGAEPYSD